MPVAESFDDVLDPLHSESSAVEFEIRSLFEAFPRLFAVRPVGPSGSPSTQNVYGTVNSSHPRHFPNVYGSLSQSSMPVTIEPRDPSAK